MFVPIWLLIVGGLGCFVFGIFLATIDQLIWVKKVGGV